MIANRFCVAFAEPDSVGCKGTEKLKGKTPGIMGWNKRLNGVADNYQLLNEIQRTWAYLESLFIHSDEVKKELPEATKRFERIDIAVKVCKFLFCAAWCHVSHGSPSMTREALPHHAMISHIANILFHRALATSVAMVYPSMVV